MNTTTLKIEEKRKALRNATMNLVRLAAVGVLAGVTVSAPARANDDPTPDTTVQTDEITTVEKEPADVVPPEEVPTVTTAQPEDVTVVDPGTVVDVPAPKATEPVTPGPVTPDVKTTAPTTPDVISPGPVTPDVKPTAPATPDVKAAAPVTPDVKTPPPAPAPAPTPAPAPVDSPLVGSPLNSNGGINLMVNRSTVVKTKVPYKQVHVAAPDIAEPILLDGGKEILINGKKPGSTQLVIWDSEGHSQIVEVVVGFDLRGLDTQLKEMFPKAAVKVDIANGTIVLRGHVPDLLTGEKVAQVATPYGATPGSPVLNFLEVSGGQQVLLQVRFAEVTRTVQQNLGFNAFVSDGKFSAGFNNGPGGNPVGGLASGSAAGIPNVPLFGSARAGNASFEFFVDALRTNGLLRILAEPNLTAISGQQASFLAGGEIPILVPQASGGGSVTTVDYKQYGIQLNFTPTVLGDGRIRLQCTPQVSDLDYAHAVNLGGEPVPALTTRNVNTTVELAEGQTFALAGLLKNEVTASKAVTPILGDLPAIGALFRSVNYQRQETELVVLVTPHLVEALNPNQVPRLPGDPWRDPTEAQLFIKGDLGGPAPDLRHAPAMHSSRFYGATGFTPVAPAAVQ